jgi:hypothetical protein
VRPWVRTVTTTTRARIREHTGPGCQQCHQMCTVRNAGVPPAGQAQRERTPCEVVLDRIHRSSTAFRPTTLRQHEVVNPCMRNLSPIPPFGVDPQGGRRSARGWCPPFGSTAVGAPSESRPAGVDERVPRWPTPNHRAPLRHVTGLVIGALDRADAVGYGRGFHRRLSHQHRRRCVPGSGFAAAIASGSGGIGRIWA